MVQKLEEKEGRGKEVYHRKGQKGESGREKRKGGGGGRFKTGGGEKVLSLQVGKGLEKVGLFSLYIYNEEEKTP
jgi:hypothetical protein